MSGNKTLVVGATGIIGGAMIRHLCRQKEFSVLGVSRSGGATACGRQTLAVDLLDPLDCERKLGPLSDIAHVFYAAYQWQPDRADEVGPNKAMLTNVVDAVANASPALR